MRKVLSIVLFLSMAICASAQIIKSEDLEKYAKERYGDKWLDAAANLQKDITLDKNQSISYQQIVEAPGKSKQDLYVMVNYWVTATFKDKQAITLNDKESGTIIISSTLQNIAQHLGGLNSFQVNITPIIKIDIKEGRIRTTLTVQNYDILKNAGGGWIVAVVDAAASDTPPTETVKYDENWEITKCYPFVEKDKHKKVSSKALVMTHAYSNVVMDKIEETIKNGLSGNEGDDW